MFRSIISFNIILWGFAILYIIGKLLTWGIKISMLKESENNPAKAVYLPFTSFSPCSIDVNRFHNDVC